MKADTSGARRRMCMGLLSFGQKKTRRGLLQGGTERSEGECEEGSGHLLDRVAHMRASVRAMARAVMAFRLMDRTETQTDIAPSWTSATAMAPAVIEARKGMNMGAPFGLGGWKSDGQRKTPWGVSRGRLRLADLCRITRRRSLSYQGKV